MVNNKTIRLIASCILALYLVHFITYLSALWNRISNDQLRKPTATHRINENSGVGGLNVQSSHTCSEVLNKTIHGYEEFKDYMKVCGHEDTPGAKNTPTIQVCNSCRFTTASFMDGNKPFVALASFGGSGNSWTRELLESITGVYTGSIYVDSAGHFPGSEYCPERGGVYIIKTHRHDDRTDHNDCRNMQVKTIFYQTAMYILRNPYGAMLSGFNLMLTGNKVGFAPRDAFGSEKWRQHVHSVVPEWKRMTLEWLTMFERPLHVIVYEDLQKHTVNELFKIGQFLHLNNTYLDLFCANTCLKPKYHRAKPEWMKTSNLYDNELRKFVNSAINEVINKLANRGNWNYDDTVEALGKYIMLPSTVED